jgi:hypothetical protein
MHLISDLKPALARLTKLSTLAVASTALAATATTWLITGSVNPWRWLADYEQSRQPAVVHLQESRQPAAERGTAPPPVPAASSPAPAAAPPSSNRDDDGSEPGDD